MYKNYLKNGIAILTPDQFKKLIKVIPNDDHVDKLEALLYTGCRYTELQWLYEHPEAFLGHTIEMPSLKAQSRHKDRYIRLNPAGRRTVKYFLRCKTNLPTHVGWNENLKRWTKLAGIDPTGISSKFTRRTWEAWLASQYDEKHWKRIFLSQGHRDVISMEYYLMLPFSDEEINDMKEFTDGWMD